MISVVCVYNNRALLERRLLSSLEQQRTCYEVVTVDNRDNVFASAASALNHGADRAAGKWVLFAHQDVALISQDWLAQAEDILECDSPTGWVGSVGVDACGKVKGFMIDRARLLGRPFYALDDVQTLDECLLIHRRLPRGQKYFDEALGGWHAYGVDACCSALRAGLKNYVIPLPIWHDSPSTNISGLSEAHEYVWRKYKTAFQRIHTTCGLLPDALLTRVNAGPASSGGIRSRMRKLCKRLFAIVGPEGGWLPADLESLTVKEQVIECLHRPAPVGNMVAEAFHPTPARRRVIHHKFCGLNASRLESDCVVISPDLAYAVLDEPELIREMARSLRRLIICVSLGQFCKRPVPWLKLTRLADAGYTAYWDGGCVLILQFVNEASRDPRRL
jgi:glycosyl transferase family 2